MKESQKNPHQTMYIFILVMLFVLSSLMAIAEKNGMFFKEPVNCYENY